MMIVVSGSPEANTLTERESWETTITRFSHDILVNTVRSVAIHE